MEWYYTGMYKYPSGNADAGADAVADADDNAGAGAGADADADDNASVGEGIKFSMIFQNLFAVFAPRVHVLSPTRRIRHIPCATDRHGAGWVIEDSSNAVGGGGGDGGGGAASAGDAWTLATFSGGGGGGGGGSDLLLGRSA